MPSRWCGRIIGPLRSWLPIAAETNPRPRLSQCRAYSVLASISLCASCIAASGIGGEVRARSRILANAGTAISSLSALPSCPLRSLMSDVLGAIAEAITRLPANHAREKERGTVVMARRSEGRVGNPRLPVTVQRSRLRPVGAPVERISRRSRVHRPTVSALEPPQVASMCLLGWQPLARRRPSIEERVIPSGEQQRLC